MAYQRFSAEEALFQGAMTFWQHWLPCRWHLTPATYLAKEDGVVLGLISVSSFGKSRTCWVLSHLTVYPEHRGRGIAQELLRYVFALFGSQGVSHFVAEVSSQNQAGLCLLGPCGFRRSARVGTYQVLDEQIKANVSQPGAYRLALSQDKQALYQMQQDALPPDLRVVYDMVPDDFSINDLPVSDLSTYSNEKLLRRLIRRKVWYWVSEDPERKVLTSAIKVQCHRAFDYHLEFCIHPGWSHMAKEAVAFVLTTINELGMKGSITVRAYDYQSGLAEALEENGLKRQGEFFLMVREHWLRAKKPRAQKREVPVGLPAIGKPAVNLPFGSV
jgi:RimJ/RimL family protein N-acetyltransferase